MQLPGNSAQANLSTHRIAAQVAEPPTAALGKFKGALLEGGMFTMMRGHSVFANPPLIITKEQIEEGFAIFDKALVHLDEAMED